MSGNIKAILVNFFPNFPWDIPFFNNTLLSFVSAIVAFFVFLLGLKLLQSIFLRAFRPMEEREGSVGAAFLSIIRSLRPPFYFFLALYFSLNYLVIPGAFRRVLDAFILIWVVYEAAHALTLFVNFLIQKRFSEGAEAEEKHTASALGVFTRIIIWIIGALFVLSNLGVEISSLLAGLGIGGIAIAFATQNIIADIFSSFAIYLDKPFKVGDHIKLGDVSGKVKKIGLRTTRLHGPDGEEVVIPNKELASSKLHNFGTKKK